MSDPTGRAQEPEEELGRRPSGDPEQLVRQLLRELRRLAGDDRPEEHQEALRLTRAYLEHAQTLAWRGVAHGDLDAPRRLLDHLRKARPFMERHWVEAAPPARAADAVRGVLDSFHVAHESLEPERTRARLADTKRSRSEREVLRVLAGEDHALRRGEVHERLRLEKPVSSPRVGQILSDLFHEHLLLRYPGPAQGNRRTSFYELSALGKKLVADLGIGGRPAAVGVVIHAAERFQVPVRPRELWQVAS